MLYTRSALASGARDRRARISQCPFYFHSRQTITRHIVRSRIQEDLSSFCYEWTKDIMLWEAGISMKLPYYLKNGVISGTTGSILNPDLWPKRTSMTTGQAAERGGQRKRSWQTCLERSVKSPRFVAMRIPSSSEGNVPTSFVCWKKRDSSRSDMRVFSEGG